jgi:hypothetical protein
VSIPQLSQGILNVFEYSETVFSKTTDEHQELTVRANDLAEEGDNNIENAEVHN